MCFVFCFKQETAYEMRISDWSSDVCSSDLQLPFDLGGSNRIDIAVARFRSFSLHHLLHVEPEISGPDAIAVHAVRFRTALARQTAAIFFAGGFRRDFCHLMPLSLDITYNAGFNRFKREKCKRLLY